MAIQNPSNLYQGNAVALDSRPSINLALQLMAKQQAKREAMDNYERSRINSINATGLRDIDRKSLDDNLSDLRSFYQQNKRDIQKGNSQQAFDYEKKFRGVRDLIASSKDRAVRHDAALKFYNDRLKQDQRLPDDFMTELHQNDMPIGSKVMDDNGEQKEPNPFDLTKWSSEAKPFNQQTFVKSFADIKGTPSVRYEKIQGQPLKQNEITETKFDKDALSVINARAADKYDNSYSFANQVQNEIKDPVRRKELSDLFSKHYGVTPNSMTDYATAYSLELMPNAAPKVKAVDNKDAIMDRRFAEQKELARLHQGWNVSNMYLRDSLKEGKSPEQAVGDLAKELSSSIRGGDKDMMDKAFAKLYAGSTKDKLVKIDYNPPIKGLTTDPVVNIVTRNSKGDEVNNIYKATDQFLDDKMKGVVNNALKAGEKKEIQKQLGKHTAAPTKSVSGVKWK